MTLSALELGRIEGALRAGGSVRKTATTWEVSVSTVQRVKKAMKNRKKIKKAKQASNKKRSKQPRQRRLASHKAEEIKNRRSRARELAKSWKLRDGNKIPAYPTPQRIAVQLFREGHKKFHRKTIARDLTAMNMKSYRRKSRPFKSGSEHRAKRADFCRRFRNKYAKKFTGNDSVFKRLVFTDETYIDTNDWTCPTMWATNASKVFPREQLNRYNVPHIQVWAAIGHNFKSPLMKVDRRVKDPEDEKKTIVKRMKKEDYARMLGRSGVVDHCVKKDLLFQHDGARCHVGVHNGYFTNKQLKYIDDWPACSPDLNPIENLWKLLKELVAEKSSDAADFNELFKIAEEVWEAIPLETINNFVLSFEKRTKKVVQSRGV